MLEELETDYEFIPVDFMAREHRSESFRKLNPNGRLPILVDGNTVLWESSAICTYLGDRFPESNLVPRPVSSERGLYHQWMSFATSELDAQLMIIGKSHAPHYFKEITPKIEIDRATRDTMAKLARQEFINFAGVVDAHLTNRRYVLDSGFSAVDIVMWWVLNSANGQGMLELYPGLQTYIERLSARPKFPIFKPPG